jgi:thiol-disulfide isomerase/thioredoxin
MEILDTILQLIKNLYNNIINHVFVNKYNLFFYSSFTFFFILLTLYSYYTFVKPALNDVHILNKEYIPNKKTDSNNVHIMFFKTEWCPHCKNVMSEWNKFKIYIKNINNTSDYKIILNVIDCDEKPDLADKYNVQAYPTVKLIYKGDVFDYDAKIDNNNLIEFINSSIKDTI